MRENNKILPCIFYVWKWYVLLVCAKCSISRRICTILCPWQTYNQNPLQKPIIYLTFCSLSKMSDKLFAFAVDFDCMFAMGKVLCKMHLKMEHFAQTSKTYHFHTQKFQGKFLLFSICKCLHFSWNKTLSKFSIILNWKLL